MTFFLWTSEVVVRKKMKDLLENEKIQGVTFLSPETTQEKKTNIHELYIIIPQVIPLPNNIENFKCEICNRPLAKIETDPIARCNNNNDYDLYCYENNTNMIYVSERLRILLQDNHFDNIRFVMV